MRPAQRGAALLTAMIIVTLVAALAATMAWRQTRAVQLEAAERARTQASWMLQGALDWARLVLREDAIGNQTKQNWDHLGEPWAVPLAEARLSTFLAAQNPSGDTDGPEAFLSGRIEDAQARYNLRNLTIGTPVNPLEQRTLVRLCTNAGVPGGTAELILQRLRAAMTAPIADNAPLAPATVAQLSWLGLPPEVASKLEPLMTLLPSATPVNLNTAPREVIAALFDGMDLASAERLVQARQNAPLASPQDALKYLPPNITISGDRASVNSSFFYVTGRLRLDEHVLQQRSLLQRSGLNVLVLDRQRLSELTRPEP
jgi:general secretion pathway protein K